jgi:hypothetical protein
MTFLVGVETAPLTMVKSADLAAVSESLLVALTMSGWAHDPVTTFRESERSVGTRFFIEATSLSAVSLSTLVSNFLHCVVLAVYDVVHSGGQNEVQPQPALTMVQVEQTPAA